MATITATDATASGALSLEYTTLNGSSDGFVYDQTKKSELILKNDSGGSLSPTIVGSSASASYE